MEYGGERELGIKSNSKCKFVCMLFNCNYNAIHKIDWIRNTSGIFECFSFPLIFPIFSTNCNWIKVKPQKNVYFPDLSWINSSNTLREILSVSNRLRGILLTWRLVFQSVVNDDHAEIQKACYIFILPSFRKAFVTGCFESDRTVNWARPSKYVKEIS